MEILKIEHINRSIFVSLKKGRIEDNEVTFGKEWCRLDIINYLLLYIISYILYK